MIGQGWIDTTATADWPDLVGELDRWGAAGRVAVLWWRDDDAVAATRQLDALLRLADEVPIALAVIPALARPDLAEALHERPEVAVLQHGWRHVNRAVAGRKSEYPLGRSAVMVAAEIAAGQARLRALFGPRALPVLVPPWNRFAEEYLPLLPAAGIAGLSAMASQRRVVATPHSMVGLDVHVDLVAWRGDRGFVGTAAALGGLIGQLRARRRADGAGDAPPLGILTHHLIMDGATAAFLDRLIAAASGHAAIRWAGLREMLQ
jgi:peptidoglycan/xylan/chitin deacetylase (PgdA/CDA1 family)